LRSRRDNNERSPGAAGFAVIAGEAKDAHEFAVKGGANVAMPGEQHVYALTLDIAGVRSEMQRIGTWLDRIEKRLGLIEA
jgi:hypothetical protein